MKAIRIKLFQEIASYRTPLTFGQRMTYPLPPYSTVIGMVHNLCNFTEYKEMNISIQGKYISKAREYFTRHEFSTGLTDDKKVVCKDCSAITDYNNKKEPVCKKCNSKNVEVLHKVRGGLIKGIGTAGIIQSKYLYDEGALMTEEEREITKDKYVNIIFGPAEEEILVNTELMIHIIPKDQSLLDTIKEAFLYPRVYPSLGRHEDLAIIKEVKIVNVSKRNPDKDIHLDETVAAYIPFEMVKDVYLKGTGNMDRSGIIYHLNKDYKLEKIGQGITRVWNTKKVLYVTNIVISEEDEVLLDEDNNVVFAA